MEPNPIRPWRKIRSYNVGDHRIFKIRTDVKESPRTGELHDFFVIETVNWVNVVALTPTNELVMVEQYRHGSNTVELEIPGGLIDATDPNPAAGGLRELREETGYEGEPVEIIGQVYPNPAIMNNTCYTLLVKNCELKHRVQFDHSEDIITRLVPVKDIARLVSEGRIRHSLVVVALYHFDLWQQRLSSSKS